MIRKDRLPNGLTILSESLPHLRSVALGMWLTRGSRHETGEECGLSHFLEHLLFKGTETRSAKEIAVAIDAIGAQMDAFTTKENACYYFKVRDQHQDFAVELLADILRRST